MVGGQQTVVRERIVQESNAILPERERIARFAIIRDRWLPGQAEELTHTGKLKRALIAGKYVEIIASL